MFTYKKNYIKELKDAIKNETYDNFMATTGKDAWEIIEDLLTIITEYDIFHKGSKNESI